MWQNVVTTIHAIGSDQMQPISGLRVDWNAGEGSIELPAKFLRESALFRADVLKDWIEQLAAIYNQTAGNDLPEMLERMQVDIVHKIVHGKKGRRGKKRRR